MENARRIMGNFSKVPSYNAQVTEEELNYIIETYSINLIFCNGHGRRLIINKLTDKYFDLRSEAL